MWHDPKNIPRTKDEAMAQLDYIASAYGSSHRGNVNEILRRIHGLLSGEIPEFRRECRYVAIKLSDMTALQREYLERWMYNNGIAARTAVVIEHDMPEYEKVWDMVADRIQSEARKPVDPTAATMVADMNGEIEG